MVNSCNHIVSHSGKIGPYKGKQARNVTLKMRYADFSTITRSRTFLENVSTDQAIFQAGVKLIDQAPTIEKQGVRLIGIRVSQLVEPSRQATLFTLSTRKLEDLNKTIDRIRNRYGFNAIQTGRVIMLKDILRLKS
ncbi:hypothetical protein ACFLTP_02070 [Chloroflexota bacterium]